MRQINNIRLPRPYKDSSEEVFWSITLDNSNTIRSINPIKNDALSYGDDWHGDWLSPMGIDLQINGGLGLAFNDLSNQELPNIYQLLDQLWSDGVEAICPTIVTSSIVSLRNSLEVLRIARENCKDYSCKLLGAHLEGPFLSERFQGAHDSKYFVQPSRTELERRIKGFEKDICLVTLAPEIEGANEIIKILKNSGILISLGHSEASAEQCQSSFEQGISMITHAFNAMNGIHHRIPGPLVEAIFHKNISVGLIADGVHIHPHIAVMLQRLFPEKLFLVSDALPSYGLNIKKFTWIKKSVIIDKDVCRLEDGTLAGTTLPLLEGCKRLAIWSDNPSSAIWATTISPRLAIKQGESIDDLLLGKPLQKLLRWGFDKDSLDLLWTQAE